MTNNRLFLGLFFICTCVTSLYAQEICSIDGISANQTLFADHRVRDLIFATADKQDIYVRTDGNLVYRSQNGGVTFVPIMENMPDFYTEFGQNNYGVSAILRGSDDGLVYFLGATQKIYWITRGDSIYKEHLTGDDYIRQITPHPDNDALVLRQLIVCNPINDTTICTTQLEFSAAQGTDGSWQFIRQYVYQYSWGEQQGQIFFVSIPDELMTGSYITVPTRELRMYMTETLGASIQFVSEPGLYAFQYLDGVVYAAKYDNETTRSDLYISPDSGDSFLPAQFRGITSVSHVDSALYVILGNDQGVSFLAVCSEDQASVGNLFQANLGDGLYWLDRPNLRATCDPYHYHGVDFQEFQSMQGTYFSNGYNSAAFDDTSNDVEDFIESAVSFNKGGTWSRLVAPEGSECAATPNCYLHLFSNVDTGSQPIFSTVESVGIVIATGTEGEFRGALEESNTYISRNGGFTWEFLREGRYQSSLAQHGSLLIMIPKEVTQEILYSWDQGISFHSCLVDEEFFVEIILDVSVDENIHFLAIGDTETGGIIYSLSLTDIAPEECEGFGTPGSDSSDYEIFQPAADGSCLLGKRFSYTRRKRDVECMSFVDERESMDGSCYCTRLDYTCDGDCWKEDIDNNGNLICSNNCVGLPNDPQAVPEDCEGSYLQPSGYRLVAGDECVEGLRLAEPVVVTCPGEVVSPSPLPSPSNGGIPSPGSPVEPPAPANPVTDPENTDTEGMGTAAVIGIIGLVIMLLLVAVVVIVLVLYKTNPKVRGLINTYLPASMGGGSGDTKLYSVLGDSEEVNSLFADDDMFLDDNVNVPVSTDKTQLGSLLDFDDDDAEGAIDIQL